MAGVFLLLIALQAMPPPQLATVTFYAPGGWWKGTAKSVETLDIGKDHPAASVGWIFDGEKELAKLTPGRFLSLKIIPGQHHLTASGANHPGTKEPEAMELDAKAGEHYFVRMTATVSGVPLVQRFTRHLEVVDCAVARGEATGAKPEKASEIGMDARGNVIEEVNFPACEGAPAPLPVQR